MLMYELCFVAILINTAAPCTIMAVRFILVLTEVKLE